MVVGTYSTGSRANSFALNDLLLPSVVLSISLDTYLGESTTNSLEPRIGESFGNASPQM